MPTVTKTLLLQFILSGYDVQTGLNPDSSSNGKGRHDTGGGLGNGDSVAHGEDWWCYDHTISFATDFSNLSGSGMGDGFGNTPDSQSGVGNGYGSGEGTSEYSVVYKVFSSSEEG